MPVIPAIRWRTAPGFAPSPAQAASHGAVTGQTLAGSSNLRLNSALALLCHLQVQTVPVRSSQ